MVVRYTWGIGSIRQRVRTFLSNAIREIKERRPWQALELNLSVYINKHLYINWKYSAINATLCVRVYVFSGFYTPG